MPTNYLEAVLRPPSQTQGGLLLLSLSLWHAPASLFGLALPSLLWEQGIAALCLLLESGNGPSVAGSLLQTSVEQAQLEV